jgi:putative transposase
VRGYHLHSNGTGLWLSGGHHGLETRAVLAWGLSNTLDVSFCIEAFHEAVRVAGRAPDIFNTDQGCQFTCRAWIETLEAAGVRVSMDGRGRWMDNVFIERLWRAVKHEGVYLWAHTDLVELVNGVSPEWH